MSAGAEGAVDSSRQVCDGSFSDQPLEELSLSVHIVHLLLLHEAHGQVVVVVQWHPRVGEIVAKAHQADLVAQQAGQVQCRHSQGRHILQKQETTVNICL